MAVGQGDREAATHPPFCADFHTNSSMKALKRFAGAYDTEMTGSVLFSEGGDKLDIFKMGSAFLTPCCKTPPCSSTVHSSHRKREARLQCVGGRGAS